MSKKPRILVLGATGQVGGAVVSLLATDKSVEVIAAARNADKAKALGVDSAYLDLDKIATFSPALENIDRIFMATGYGHAFPCGRAAFNDFGSCSYPVP